MERPLDLLSQPELLALAVEASRRGDSGHAMAYLKSGAERADVTAEVLFMLGSEYAQVGLMDEARACMARALALAPGYAIARFQLGLLYLTSGQAEPALQTWEPLDDLDPAQPQVAYLQAFHQGLKHLICDEFPDVLTHLLRGVELNQENQALNQDMQRILNDVKALLARTVASDDQAAAQADNPGQEGEEAATASHLFINAYTGGKPH